MIIDVFEGLVDVFVVDENDEFIVIFNEIFGYYKVKIKLFVLLR